MTNSRSQVLAALACGLATCGAAGAPSFGAMLVKSMVALAAVAGLAVLTLRLAAKHGWGRPPSPAAGARLAVLDELPLGGRTSVIAIRAGAKVVLASRTAAGLTPLATMTATEYRARGFSEVLGEAAAPTEPARRSAAAGDDVPDIDDDIAWSA